MYSKGKSLPGGVGMLDILSRGFEPLRNPDKLCGKIEGCV